MQKPDSKKRACLPAAARFRIKENRVLTTL